MQSYEYSERFIFIYWETVMVLKNKGKVGHFEVGVRVRVLLLGTARQDFSLVNFRSKFEHDEMPFLFM